MLISRTLPLGCLHFFPSLLHSESLVVQLLEGEELERQQLIAKARTHSLTETLLPVSITCHVPWGVTSQAVELTAISCNIHASLVQLQELFPLHFHDGLRNIGSLESRPEFLPSEGIVSWVHSLVAFPRVSYTHLTLP